MLLTYGHCDIYKPPHPLPPTLNSGLIDSHRKYLVLFTNSSFKSLTIFDFISISE